MKSKTCAIGFAAMASLACASVPAQDSPGFAGIEALSAAWAVQQVNPNEVRVTLTLEAEPGQRHELGLYHPYIQPTVGKPAVHEKVRAAAWAVQEHNLKARHKLADSGVSAFLAIGSSQRSGIFGNRAGPRPRSIVVDGDEPCVSLEWYFYVPNYTRSVEVRTRTTSEEVGRQAVVVALPVPMKNTTEH